VLKTYISAGALTDILQTNLNNEAVCLGSTRRSLPHSTNQFYSLAAYLLLGLGGNDSPSASDIKAVLSSVGVEADDERLEKLLSELKGKDINEVRS
jgi:hypothetical protein